ncbi:Cell division inhibitor MinD [Serratia plymuthica]|uniref:Iron-sulfur cluster carrier protein n=1 Tax=Serratia plymuthica TaxID=82996 RepID=A0A2X4U7R4_SERPL|nr:Cell division inhibitor MinD [Serratia plymuthica]
MSAKSPEQTNPEVLRALVTGVLAAFEHPTLKNNLTALKAIHHCTLLDHVLHIELIMPFAWQSAFETLKDRVSAELLRVTGAEAIDWKLKHDIATLKRANDQAGIKGVRNIIAISSGKGGVGKSTTAVNLALALAAEGAKVGILDADIYGPSIPNMLGTEHERPTSPDGQHMAPILAHGLATNSIGYLVTDDNAMVWRGPMASKALMQLLQDTLWPDLDYLVLDMPPGTGDIQLTLSQNIPVTGALVVTTPQDIALLDAAKGIVMFEKVHVPVLGIVENMSVHICSNCGHHEPIFRHWRGRKVGEKVQQPLAGATAVAHLAARGFGSRRADGNKPSGQRICGTVSPACRPCRGADVLAGRGYSDGNLFPRVVILAD